MNWVKENIFLSCFTLVLLIGIGALGFEVYSASSAADEAASQYTDKSNEYNRLRHIAPYPSKQNLDAYEKQKKDAAEVITAFQTDLAKNEFPLEPNLTPEGFQDLLKATVTAVRAKAAEAGVKLPEKDFFLGFERYETSPPTPNAAAPLGRQLKAIEWVVGQYITNSALEIRSLSRTDLPEEQTGGGERKGQQQGSTRPGGNFGNLGAGPGGSPGAGNRPGSGAARSELVKYFPFTVSAIFKLQKQLASTLNAIAGRQAPQFYVLRSIRIANQNQKGPSKITDASKPKGPDYIVGEELIEAAAEYDVVDFVAPPSEKAHPPAK